MMTILGPNLQLVWAKVNETALSVSEKFSAHLGWLTDNLPGLIEWVRMEFPLVIPHQLTSLEAGGVSKTGSAQSGVFEGEDG